MGRKAPDYQLGTGMLFPVKNRASDRAPQWSGTVTIDGVEYPVVGWWKHKGSDQLISLRVNKARAKQAAPVQNSEPEDPEADPF